MRSLFVALLFLPTLLLAEPVVQSVMFFSSDCTHCHDVLDNTIEPILEAHPDQVEFLLVNVNTDSGARLFYQVVDSFRVPAEEQGVPILLIGDNLLIGGDEIPAHLPALVAAALTEGGRPLPPIPGLAEAAAGAEAITIREASDIQSVPSLTLGEKLASDRIGTSLAIALLVIMILSIISVTKGWIQNGLPLGRGKPYTRLIPFLSLAGLGIAIYLGYIELTGEEAICGYIGNCEAVQNSPYSWLFGVFPIGILGAVTYLFIIATWAWRSLAPRGRRCPADLILPALTFASVIFSIYLTFLEPFVIGAVCMWCLTSAAIVTALLWLTHPNTSKFTSRNGSISNLTKGS